MFRLSGVGRLAGGGGGFPSGVRSLIWGLGVLGVGSCDGELGAWVIWRDGPCVGGGV